MELVLPIRALRVLASSEVVHLSDEQVKNKINQTKTQH